MQFLYRRHPEIGMWLELPIKPRSSRFLRAHAQEIRARITGGTVMLFSIADVLDPRLEWPRQTHVALFSQVPSTRKDILECGRDGLQEIPRGNDPEHRATTFCRDGVLLFAYCKHAWVCITRYVPRQEYGRGLRHFQKALLFPPSKER